MSEGFGQPGPDPVQPSRVNLPRAILRNGVALVAVAVLAVSAFVALDALGDTIRIWFEPHVVPIARAVAASLVVAGCLAVLWRLAQRPDGTNR